jgi:hypothetical protein
MNEPVESVPSTTIVADTGLQRHPFRGLLSGVLLGIGLALLVLVYGKAPFSTATPYVCLVAGVIAGLAFGLAGPPRRHRVKA